jgi:hypothetical protein
METIQKLKFPAFATSQARRRAGAEKANVIFSISLDAKPPPARTFSSAKRMA